MRTYESHEDPRDEQAELAIRLFHAAKLDPSFTIGGLSGVQLKNAALDAILEMNIPEAPYYLHRNDSLLFQEAYNRGTHSSLSVAIQLAYQWRSFEVLSMAWYAREELEVAFKDGSLTETEADTLSLSNRHFNGSEFEVLLAMAQGGFEDLEPALQEALSMRAHMARTYMDCRSDEIRLKRTIAFGMLTSDECTQLEKLTGKRFAYMLFESAAQKVEQVTRDKKTLQYINENRTALAEDVVGFAAYAPDGDATLFATELIPTLMKADPDNATYRKWHKKLRRRFTRNHYFEAVVNAFALGTSPSFTATEAETALHNLGEPTLWDSTAVYVGAMATKADIED